MILNLNYFTQTIFKICFCLQVYKKRHKKAFNLPRERCSISFSKTETELTFSQVLHYVAKTNYQNLWKDFYKKYYGKCLNKDINITNLNKDIFLN